MAPARNDPEVTESADEPPTARRRRRRPRGRAGRLVRRQRLAHLGAGRARRHRCQARASYAWDEYTRNTLAAHAHAFPDHWDGTISVDDACNALVLERTRRAAASASFWIPGPDHRAAHVDGHERAEPRGPDADARRLPDRPAPAGRRFSLRFQRVGVARGPERLRGYVRVSQGGRLVLEVRVPRGARGVTASAGGQAVRHRRSTGGFVTFRLPASPGRAADWAVAWR